MGTKQTRHTPGPWVSDEGVFEKRHLIEVLSEDWQAVGIADDDGYAAHVAYCHPDNVPLIAAAPELLAALELIYANAAESPEWIRERIGPIIKKATT